MTYEPVSKDDGARMGEWATCDRIMRATAALPPAALKAELKNILDACVWDAFCDGCESVAGELLIYAEHYDAHQEIIKTIKWELAASREGNHIT
jgi:hypothetical protein